MDEADIWKSNGNKWESNMNEENTKKTEEFISCVEAWNLLQLKKFVDGFQEAYFKRLGLTAPAVAVSQVKVETIVPVEEKTDYTVNLITTGANKIQVIKEIRTLTSMGLKEAKDLTEATPKAVKTGASKEDAAKIKAALEAVGATVEVV